MLASFSPVNSDTIPPVLGMSDDSSAKFLRTLIAALHFLASMPSPRASSKSFIALAITGRDSANLSSCFSPKNPPARLASPDNSSAPVRISIASAKFLMDLVVSGPNILIVAKKGIASVANSDKLFPILGRDDAIPSLIPEINLPRATPSPSDIIPITSIPVLRAFLRPSNFLNASPIRTNSPRNASNVALPAIAAGAINPIAPTTAVAIANDPRTRENALALPTSADGSPLSVSNTKIAAIPAAVTPARGIKLSSTLFILTFLIPCSNITKAVASELRIIPRAVAFEIMPSPGAKFASTASAAVDIPTNAAIPRILLPTVLILTLRIPFSNT